MVKLIYGDKIKILEKILQLMTPFISRQIFEISTCSLVSKYLQSNTTQVIILYA